jgi:RNA polymerase sigma factor (sigma-70 family)
MDVEDQVIDHDAEPSALTGTEGGELAASAARSRAADREVAAALGRAEPSGRAATVGYLDELGRRVALSRDVEVELVSAAQAGDAAARARLVEAFTPLIASVARVYRDSARVERVELLQEGVVGLLRALERYDAERGVPFWAYAGFWVRQAMQQVVADVTRPMVLSDRGLRQLARLKDAHREALRETGREPARDELVTRSGLTREQVDCLLLAERPARSTDEHVEAHDGAVGTFGDLLVDPLADGEYERVLDAIEIEQLLALLSALSERERDILRARYGLDGEEQSLRQVGARLGLSAERVRQLEDRALGKLAAAAGTPRP